MLKFKLLQEKNQHVNVDYVHLPLKKTTGTLRGMYLPYLFKPIFHLYQS